MAKDAVSASILKSNLELLKKEGQELLNLFESVNKQSQALGTNMSQSVRSVVGEVRRLESSLSGLQSRLNRLTSTSSALGAANISGALGALTGQGRGFPEAVDTEEEGEDTVLADLSQEVCLAEVVD